MKWEERTEHTVNVHGKGKPIKEMIAEQSFVSSYSRRKNIIQEIVGFCHGQFVSVTDSLCLSQTVCACHTQSVYETHSLCMSHTVCVCHRHRQYVFSQVVFVCHRKLLSVSFYL